MQGSETQISGGQAGFEWEKGEKYACIVVKSLIEMSVIQISFRVALKEDKKSWPFSVNWKWDRKTTVYFSEFKTGIVLCCPWIEMVIWLFYTWFMPGFRHGLYTSDMRCIKSLLAISAGPDIPNSSVIITPSLGLRLLPYEGHKDKPLALAYG